MTEKEDFKKFKRWCIDCWATGKVDWIEYTKSQRRPMPYAFEELFRLSDRSRNQQLEIIEDIKTQICLDTDVECPTCEGKGYTGYFDLDPPGKLILSYDYFDELGYKLVVENDKLILIKKIEFSFENFVKWFSKKLKSPILVWSLGDRTTFIATLENTDKIRIEYGRDCKAGFVTTDEMRRVWQRYLSLGNRKHTVCEYTSPRFHGTRNRILAPYVAAIIRDFEDAIHGSEKPI